MGLRRFMRESAFRLARHDLAMFLEDHEEHLLHIFREEMERLDDEMPEENVFIDIRMVPLGEAILKSALRAIIRFLTENASAGTVAQLAANIETLEEAAADLAGSKR